MKKCITIVTLLAAGTAFANAGTPYYWIGESTEYTLGWSQDNETKWRNTDGSTTYVLPESADTIDALKNLVATGSIPNLTTTGDKVTSGIDFVLGGDDATISVDKFYYLSGFKTSNWSSEKTYTFNFGESGAIYSRYETKFESFGKLNLNVALSGSGERVLFGTAAVLMNDSETYDWSTMTLSTSLFEKTTLTADGYTVREGVFTDKNDLSLNAGEAALLYANNTISVLYQAIPEPSAFGLLAGLGALALVGTRRRRR